MKCRCKCSRGRQRFADNLIVASRYLWCDGCWEEIGCCCCRVRLKSCCCSWSVLCDLIDWGAWGWEAIISQKTVQEILCWRHVQYTKYWEKDLFWVFTASEHWQLCANLCDWIHEKLAERLVCLWCGSLWPVWSMLDDAPEPASLWPDRRCSWEKRVHTFFASSCQQWALTGLPSQIFISSFCLCDEYLHLVDNSRGLWLLKFHRWL